MDPVSETLESGSDVYENSCDQKLNGEDTVHLLDKTDSGVVLDSALFVEGILGFVILVIVHDVVRYMS